MKNLKTTKPLLMIMLMMALISTISTVSATPKVIITFDDGDSSVYLKAFPIMKANNQPGVAFLITGRVPGASGKNGFADLNLTQAKNLYSNGWDISSHTVNHKDLTKLTASDINKELNTSKNWLEKSGFTTSSRFFAYPFGGYNSKVIASVKNNGYLAARTTDDIAGSYKAYKLSDTDIYQIETTMVYPFSAYGKVAEPPDIVKKKINDTVAQDGLLILSFHIISDVCCDNPGKYSTSDFKIISDFLREQEDKGKLDVVTMSEYFAPSTGTNTVIKTDKNIYSQGEIVQFTIYNNNSSTLEIDFKPSVLDNNTGNCVWGCIWAAVYTPIIVSPGGNHSWTWDQKGENGTVSPGYYKGVLGEYYSNEFEIIPQQDIVANYRGLGQDPAKVETGDLLKAADDWRDNIVPSGFSTSIVTSQLLALADEWRSS